MKGKIKEIVNSSNIQLFEISEDVFIPRHAIRDPERVKGLQDKLLKALMSKMVGFLSTEKFFSAMEEGTTVRYKGEIIMCTREELLTVLEKVYEEGKIKSLIDTKEPFEYES